MEGMLISFDDFPDTKNTTSKNKKTSNTFDFFDGLNTNPKKNREDPPLISKETLDLLSGIDFSGTKPANGNTKPEQIKRINSGILALEDLEENVMEEVKIFEEAANIYIYRKDTEQKEWESIDSSISSIAIFHLRNEDIFRIVILTSSFQYVVNSWISPNILFERNETFAILHDLGVNTDYGFLFASVESCIKFLDLIQSCSSITLNRFSAEHVTVFRKKVLHELLLTEESYVESMKILMKVYFEPLKEALSSRPIISQKKIKIIFMCAEDVLIFHKKLLTQIENALQSREPRVGHVFLNMASDFYVYIRYVKLYSESQKTLLRVTEKNSNFRSFLQECRRQPVCQSKGIEDFLIMPIQRVPRYILLLEELLKYTPKDHRDYSNLVEALKKVKDLAHNINESKKADDHISELIAIYKKLVPKPKDFVLNHRRKIKEGEVIQVKSKLKKKARYIYLFNDILLVCKEKKLERGKYLLRYLVNLPTTVVSEQCSIGKNSYGNGFSILTPTRTFLFTCSTEEERNVWIKIISDSISKQT